MKAKRKPLDIIDVETLSLSLEKHREILSVQAPAVRKAGIMVESVDALLDKLRNEAKVL